MICALPPPHHFPDGNLSSLGAPGPRGRSPTAAWTAPASGTAPPPWPPPSTPALWSAPKTTDRPNGHYVACRMVSALVVNSHKPFFLGNTHPLFALGSGSKSNKPFFCAPTFTFTPTRSSLLHHCHPIYIIIHGILLLPPPPTPTPHLPPSAALTQPPFQLRIVPPYPIIPTPSHTEHTDCTANASASVPWAEILLLSNLKL